MKLKLIFTASLMIVYILNQNISTVYAKNELDSSKLNCTSYFLYDPKSGIALAEKNSNEKLAPASTTKIMTSLLVLEKTNDEINDNISFSHKAIFSVPRDSSNIAINEGEILSVKDAMYGLLLPSANEVANAFAEYVSGDIKSFAELMTLRAKELGATNTNFANPNGLDDENHYTTSHDLAMIMQEAIKHSFFLKVISTNTYLIPPTNLQKDERPIVNSNKLIFPDSKFYNKDVLGGKTGYTVLSGENLVALGQQGDNQLIVVTMKGLKDEPYEDTTRLLKYGFDTFQYVNLVNSTDYSKSIDVVDDNKNKIGFVNVNAIPLSMNLPVINNVNDATKNFTYSVNLPTELAFPVKINDVVGDITVYNNGKEINKTNIIVNSDFVSTVSATVKPVEQDTKKTSSQILTMVNGINLPPANLSVEVKKIIPIAIVSFVALLFIFGILNSIRKKRKARRRYRFK